MKKQMHISFDDTMNPGLGEEGTGEFVSILMAWISDIGSYVFCDIPMLSDLTFPNRLRRCFDSRQGEDLYLDKVSFTQAALETCRITAFIVKGIATVLFFRREEEKPFACLKLTIREGEVQEVLFS